MQIHHFHFTFFCSSANTESQDVNNMSKLLFRVNLCQTNLKIKPRSKSFLHYRAPVFKVSYRVELFHLQTGLTFSRS